MNIQDQWFEPGDKVMRVSHNRAHPSNPDGTNDVPYGQVNCVELCRSVLEDYNAVKFVGNASLFVASNFRKVEEIKLCVEAVRKARTNNPQPQIA